MRKAGWLALSAASLLGGLAAWWIAKNSRFTSEPARYEVIVSDGAFELREYEALRLAGTTGAEDDDSFTRLFGYISGRNRERRKIPMTVPVIIAESRGERSMNFVLSREAVHEGPPRPSAPDIEMVAMPAGCFAAYRFHGVSDMLSEAANAAVLRAWVREQGFEPEGEALIALYDPPWVPGPLRRNEVLQRVI